MKHARLALVCLVAIMMAGAGCRHTLTSDEGDNPASAVTPMLAVAAAPVTVNPMHSELDLLGITAALRHVTLRAPTNGRLVGFKLQSGDRVVRGEVVGHIINRELEAAEAGLAAAQKIDPDEAGKLRASVERYAHGPGIAVKSPANAIVAQRLVSSSQIVAYLDPLADLVDPNSIYVEAQVPIDAQSLVRPGMPATVTSPIQPHTEFPTRVVAMAPNFNPASETSTARLQFTGEQKIMVAGAAVQVHIAIRLIPDALTIPNAAVFENAATDKYYVFVAGADGRAHRVSVTIGIRKSDRVQVTTGLKAGELVITSGGYALADGLKVKVIPARTGQQ
jgi:multidrug efflux pump subunit AcrA (membrane-fusion protein)